MSPLGRERSQPHDKPSARTSAKASQSKRPAAREERVSLHCEIDGLPAELELSELSAAGVFVVTTQPLLVDSEVSIFLRVGAQRFEMTGHVVHTVSCEQATRVGKKPGYALLFTNLADKERKRLSVAVPTKPAPKPAAPAYDPAELALVEQLKLELAQMDDKTAWAVLGVSQGADAEQLRTAFLQASKRYHPHLFARYSHPEIKRVVTELFIAHKRAFTTMTKLNKKHV